MRKELKEIEGVRNRFTATISKIGKKPGYKGRPALDTVLLTSIKSENGAIIADHLWLTIGQRMSCIYNNVGRTLSFEARVTKYTKGYKGKGLEVLKLQQTDYRLSNPTNVVVL